MKERKQMDLDERELGGAERRETIIRIYYVKEKPYFQ